MKTTIVALCTLMLWLSITANAENSADSNKGKAVSNAGLRSDGELVQDKKPKKLLGHELSHIKQQGRVMTDSDVNAARHEQNHNHIDLIDATIAPIRQESLSKKRNKINNSLKK